MTGVHEYQYRDEQAVAWGKPDTIEVTVTDTDGNTAVLVDDRDSGITRVYAASAAAISTGGQVAVRSKPLVAIPYGEFVAGGAAIGIGGGSLIYHLATGDAFEGELSGQITRPVPQTPTEGTWNHPEIGEISLPSGAVFEDPTGQGYERGFGWAYIDETSSLTLPAIGHVLEDPDVVIDEGGEARYIIGELPAGEKVILSIIGGTIATASVSSVYNEDCGATININEGDNPHHSLRDGKPIDELTTLIEVLENPTRIVDAGSKRYYILKVGTNRVLMVSTALYDKVYQALRTTLRGNGPDNAFKTIDEAMEYIDDHHKDYEIIHDPENGIEC